MNRKKDVIIIGAAIVDLPLRPVGKEVFDVVSYPVDDISMTVGGDALNEATIITRLGSSVSLMSIIGNDIAGDFILEHCDNNNIDTKYIKKNKEISTSINVGLVDINGERTFITNKNGSLWKFKYEDLDLSILKNAKILSFASIFNNPLFNNNSLVSIFSKAKEEGMLICADMVSPRLDEKLEDIKEALSYLDYFFPNYDEASQLTGELDESRIVNILYNCGIKNVVMKIGKKGCYIKNKNGEFIVPACKDIIAIDTIGAGDNFASGFISGILDGKSIKDCAIYANCTAAVSVQYSGATGGVKNRTVVDKMLEKYHQDYKLI